MSSADQSSHQISDISVNVALSAISMQKIRMCSEIVNIATLSFSIMPRNSMACRGLGSVVTDGDAIDIFLITSQG